MKLLKPPFIVAVTALLASCTTPSEIMNEKLQSIPISERSYILGRYSVTCEITDDTCEQRFNSISALYHDIPNKEFSLKLESLTGSSLSDDTLTDFINLDTKNKGYYFCIALLPGKYSFYATDYYNFRGGGTGFSLKEDNYFDVPFVLEPSDLLYIGRLRVTTTKGKNIFGQELDQPGVLYLSSDLSSDQQKVLKKCPTDVRARTVKNIPLKLSKDPEIPHVKMIPKN